MAAALRGEGRTPSPITTSFGTHQGSNDVTRWRAATTQMDVEGTDGDDDGNASDTTEKANNSDVKDNLSQGEGHSQSRNAHPLEGSLTQFVFDVESQLLWASSPSIGGTNHGGDLYPAPVVPLRQDTQFESAFYGNWASAGTSLSRDQSGSSFNSLFSGEDGLASPEGSQTL